MEIYEMLLYAVLLIVIGLMSLLKPQLLWKLENFLTTKGGEPSDLYLTMSALGGTLSLLCGFGLLIFSISKFFI